MKPIHATVFCRSLSPHLTQSLTGLVLLHRAGIIRLKQVLIRRGQGDERASVYGPTAHEAHLLLLLEDSVRVYYDMQDAQDINLSAAEGVDLYFKRSYAREAIPPALRARVHPYGLNYAVYADGRDGFEIRRRLFFEPEAGKRLRAMLRLALRGMDMSAVAPGFRATMGQMSAPPERAQPPRVLFMARAWDPTDDPARPAEKVEQRRQINEVRAECVRLLRKEFGAAFTGGFRHTPYALTHHKDVLLPDDRLSTKENYIRLLREHSIGIATTGLHESIGWKLAEYAAFSKAIAAERLRFEVPGELAAGENYLEFDSPETCVIQTLRLFTDRGLREAMMECNQRYYEACLRPDVLMLRTLCMAMPGRFPEAVQAAHV
ncbi:MAG: hypothetical protein NTY23_10580 [Chloroflexi bacterium]|nr:hypothetical protein [Chloroflexota bacterium]